MALELIKITQLDDIGGNLNTQAVMPIVNLVGTTVTNKVTVGNLANLMLSNAGVNYPPALQANVAYFVTNNNQPNITSVGTLTSLTVSGNVSFGPLVGLTVLGTADFTQANVQLGSVSNINITGGTAGQILSTDGTGNLSWINDANSSYGNSNVANYLPTYTGNLSAGNADLGNAVIANYFVGNGSLLTGVTSYGNSNAVSYAEAGWSGNIIPSSDAVYSLGNSTNQWRDLYVSNASIYMDNVPIGLSAGNILTVGGQPLLSNNSNTSITTTGNITADNLTANTITTTGNISVGNIIGNGQGLTGINGSNIIGSVSNATYATLAGSSNTVITNAQPNITSVGTLSSLSVSGIANVGNIQSNGILSVIGRAQVSNNITAVSLSNIGLSIYANSFSNGTNAFAAVGAYNDLYASLRLISFGSNYANFPNLTGLYSSANTPIVFWQNGDERWRIDASGNLVGITTTAATSTTTGALQITGGAGIVGNLYAGNLHTTGLLSVTGNANVGNISATSGVFTNVSGNGAALTSITGANVAGPVAYAITANSVSVGNVSGIGNIATINLDNNSSNVLYGNGVFAAVSSGSNYGDNNVTSLLSSFGSNSISTTGNITANNFIGNVSITGNISGTSPNVTLIAGSYSYVFDNTGNATFANGIATFPGTTTGINAIKTGVTNTLLPNTVTSFSANVNSYTQITLQNKSSGADATADYIITADNGSDTVNYLDLGIINSGYDASTPTNSLGNIISAGDGYLYAQGNTSNASQSGGNLAIGTTVLGKVVKVFAGGANSDSVVATFSNTGISGNTNGFAIGYRDIPQLAASNTTLALSDAGKHYYSTTAGNLTLTIPANNSVAFSTGTAITIVVQAAGNVLVNAASGVSLYMAGNSTTANRVVGAYGMATLLKVAANTWFINGTGVS